MNMSELPECRVEYRGFMTCFKGVKSKFIKWRTLSWWNRLFIHDDKGIDALS